MPKLSDHQSRKFTKLLAIGDSKSGKTGSLVSLVKAGYKLRILDFDNLLDVLKYYVENECPEKIDNIEFRSLRDKYKASVSGPVVAGKATAFINGMKMIERWKYTEEDGTEVDLGDPSEWGPDTILVIDSLSRLCDAAFDFRLPLTPKDKSGQPNMQACYGDAQDAVLSMLGELASEHFATNVIIICHIRYLSQPDGSIKGFPQGVGSAICPIIPQYFPSMILYTNKGGKRTIQTNASAMIDLANPKPFAMGDEYPIETGLADFFSVLRDPPAKAKPKSLTLRRA